VSAPHEFPCPQCGGASENEPGCVRVNDPGADGDRSPGLTNGGYSTERSGTLFAALRRALARPFYWIGTAFVIIADALDPRPEGPNG
jgi:hypothetical protein